MAKKITVQQLAMLCVIRPYVSAKNSSSFSWTPDHQKQLGDNPPHGEDFAELKGVIQSNKKLKQYEPAQRIFELRTEKGKSGIYESGQSVCWNLCSENVIIDPAAYNGKFEISFELTEKERWALDNLIIK